VVVYQAQPIYALKVPSVLVFIASGLNTNIL